MNHKGSIKAERQIVKDSLLARQAIFSFMDKKIPAGEILREFSFGVIDLILFAPAVAIRRV